MLFIGTHDDQEERCSFVVAKAAALRRSHKLNIQHSVQHQRYNGSRVPSSRLCASTRGVCIWLVHSSRGSNHENINLYNATVVKHTSSDVTPGIRSIQRQQKQYCVAHTCAYISLQRVSPFRLATPPGYEVNPIPKGNLVCLYDMLYYAMMECIGSWSLNRLISRTPRKPCGALVRKTAPAHQPSVLHRKINGALKEKITTLAQQPGVPQNGKALLEILYE